MSESDDYAVSIIGPSFVMSIVCSNCAVRLSSLVTAVHPSSRTSNSAPPSLMTGSAREANVSVSVKHTYNIIARDMVSWCQDNI